jgi:hypothetical protein
MNVSSSPYVAYTQFRVAQNLTCAGTSGTHALRKSRSAYSDVPEDEMKQSPSWETNSQSAGWKSSRNLRNPTDQSPETLQRHIDDTCKLRAFC